VPEVAHLGVEADVDGRATRAALVPRHQRVGRRIALRCVQLVMDGQGVIWIQLERPWHVQIARVGFEGPSEVEAGQRGDRISCRGAGHKGARDCQHASAKSRSPIEQWRPDETELDADVSPKIDAFSMREP
jgi:hypothetical protein